MSLMFDVVDDTFDRWKCVSFHRFTKAGGGLGEILFPVRSHLIPVTKGMSKIWRVLAVVELTDKRNSPCRTVEARIVKANATQVVSHRLKKEQAPHEGEVWSPVQQRLKKLL